MLKNLKLSTLLLAMVAMFSLPSHATYLGDPTPVNKGGTNATTAAGARSSLGALAKAGDTMTGVLGLDFAGVDPSSLLTLDADRKVQSSSSVSLTELGYLDGVTSSIGDKINQLSVAEFGYMAGVTSSVGAKINQVSVAEMGYLAGVTSGIQAQINAISGMTENNKVQVAVVNNAASPYSVLSTDEVIVCDSSGGNVVINLLAVAGSGKGRVLDVKKIVSANTCTVTADSGGTPDLIDGAASKVISNQWENLTIVEATGSNAWYVR